MKPGDTDREFNLRLYTDFNFFSEIHIDIKVMPESDKGHKYILILVCAITRYTICLKLKDRNAQTIAEKLLRKVFLERGVPDKIVCDEVISFVNQIMQYIFNALNIEVKVVSPYNHGSLISERYIKTLNNFICSNLTGNGRQWWKYTEVAAGSFNRFSIPCLDNYSPFYLLNLRKRKNLCNFEYTPLHEVSKSYRDYVSLLNARLNHVGKTTLELQRRNQEKQAEIQRKKVRSRTVWKENILVYLLAPTASQLRTASKKLTMHYVGPL